MIIAFWIVGGITALAFLAAGLMKVTRPKQTLATNMGWVEDTTAGAVKAIGLVEVIGALGIVLPALTRIAPALTTVAAFGLAAVMIAAVIVHARRHESPVAPIVLAALAVATAIINLTTL